MDKKNRPSRLFGNTYTIQVPNIVNKPIDVEITVNDDADGNPFENFINTTDGYMYEWCTATKLLVSCMLQYGIPVDVIATKLDGIASMATKKLLPGTTAYVESLPTRLAHVLKQHLSRPLDDRVPLHKTSAIIEARLKMEFDYED